MITVRELEGLYCMSDELAASGDRGGAEAFFLQAVAAVEEATREPIRTKAEAVEALELARYLAASPALQVELARALEAAGLERLIVLRRALGFGAAGGADAVPMAIIGRALAVLAQPRLASA